MNKLFSSFFSFFKKELMLFVALAAAIISLFITPPTTELFSEIDWHTLATLFMLLTVLEGFKKENIFNPVLHRTLNIKKMKTLTAFFVYSVFLSSMFVTNDVSLIIFVPLTIILFRSGNKEKYILPVLTLENIAAIRGSLLTPFGSPQNLFLFSQSGIAVKDFLLMMLPLWIFSAGLLYVFILILYRKDLKEPISAEEKNVCHEWEKDHRHLRILYISLFILVILSIVTRTRFWPIVTLIVAVSVLLMDRKLLMRTDYVLLLTFFCFFVFSSSICKNPVISDFLKSNVGGHEYIWSILLSQIISNVPASIVLWPFTQNLRALIYGLDSAGLCSIIGSLASVINLRIYSKEYPGNAGKFIKTFTWISLAFFAVVVGLQYLLIINLPA